MATSPKAVDTNLQLKQGETPEQYTARVAEYQGGNGGTPSPAPAPAPTANVDTNYYLKPGESIDAYTTRVKNYNASQLDGSIGSVPTPNSAISATSLGGNADIDSYLKAGVANGTVSSDTAGLLSLLDASTNESNNFDTLSNDLISAYSRAEGQGTDLAGAYEEYGVNSSRKQLAELSQKAAKQRGSLEAFDAETTTGLSNLDDQQDTAGFISGSQGAYQKKRDLTRLAMAAEFSATSALMQAYQGNVTLAKELATEAVTFKYAPILARIDTIKAQLGVAEGKLSRSDSKRATIIGALMDTQKAALNAQKGDDEKVQSLAIQAASAGAPVEVVSAMQNASDPVSAASIGAAYLHATGEDDSSGGAGFSATQLNGGASNAGLPISEFRSLDADTQNYFINGYDAFKTFQDEIDAGDRDAQEVADLIAASNQTDAVKSVLYRKLGATGGVTPAGGDGDWWGAAGSAVANGWNALGAIFK